MTHGSHKKAWWKCEKGHSWEAIISNRTRLKRSCPYCAGQRPIIGVNDLRTTCPELVKEWNYSKNKEDIPEQHMMGSHKKVWWVCSEGHEWEAQINSRSRGVGCPYCSNKKVLKGYNDLATMFPSIAAEWNYDKNDKLKPTDVTYGSGKNAWWICKNGHEWKSTVDNRTRGKGCPICNNQRRTSFPEQAIYYYVKKAFPDALNSYKDIFKNSSMELDVFIPSISVGIEYDGKRYHTNNSNRIRDAKKYKICKENGIILIRITDNLMYEMITNCDHKITIPKADNQNLTMAISYMLYKLGANVAVDVERDRIDILNYLIKKDISLQTEFPEIADEWNHEKNEGLLPSMFHPGSNEKVWWKCKECGWEWRTSLAERTGRDKTNCPKCALKKGALKHSKTILKEKGSIVETHPNLLLEWDYDKNSMLPQDITAGSGVKVWWKCKKCGYSWKTTAGHRTNRNSGCPCCSNQVVVKGINDLTTTHPHLVEEWDFEKNVISPQEIVAGTGKKVWWICKRCGHNWSSVVNSRAKGVGCPNCDLIRKRRILDNQISLFDENE